MSSARINASETGNDTSARQMFEEDDFLEMALRKERMAQAKTDRLQRRLDELQLQLLESLQQKQLLADEALLASQEKVRALRELKRVDNERQELRLVLSQMQQNDTPRDTRRSSISDPFLKTVQGELESLQQQMESARVVYEENEQLKKQCHALTADLAQANKELEAMNEKQAHEQATQGSRADGDMLFTVRHRRQGFFSSNLEPRDTRDEPPSLFTF